MMQEWKGEHGSDQEAMEDDGARDERAERVSGGPESDDDSERSGRAHGLRSFTVSRGIVTRATWVTPALRMRSMTRKTSP